MLSTARKRGPTSRLVGSITRAKNDNTESPVSSQEKLDGRKLLISGFETRRAEAYPDIAEGSSLMVVIESNQRTRQENRAELFLEGMSEMPVEVDGAQLAQIAACIVRAAHLAVKDGVVAPLSPESTELLARLEAAVAQGDSYNA